MSKNGIDDLDELIQEELLKAQEEEKQSIAESMKALSDLLHELDLDNLLGVAYPSHKYEIKQDELADEYEKRRVTKRRKTNSSAS